MNNKGYWLSYILFFWGLLGWKCIFVFHQWQRWNWGNQGAITSGKITSSASFLRLFIFCYFFSFLLRNLAGGKSDHSFSAHSSSSFILVISSHLNIIITTTTIILYNNNDIILFSPSIYSTSSSTLSSLHFSLILHRSPSRSTQCCWYERQ